MVPYHEIVELKPLKPSFRYHRRSNQRTDCSTQTVATMQEPQHLIRTLHVAYPGIPASVLQSIAKSGQHEDDGKNWVGWMNAGDHVCYDLANWSYCRNPKLAEVHVDFVIE